MTQQNKEEQKKLLSEIMEADQRDGLYDNHIGDANKMVTAVEWLAKIYLQTKKIDSFDIEQAKELHKADVMRSYRAGMMQGLRMLQSYMTFQQQESFGFHDKEDGKINAILDKESKEYYIKT